MKFTEVEKNKRIKKCEINEAYSDILESLSLSKYLGYLDKKSYKFLIRRLKK